MGTGHLSRNRLGLGLVASLCTFCCAAGTVALAPSSWAANSIPTPTVTVPALPSTWSALGTGTLASPDVASGLGALVGAEVKAQIGTIDFTGTSGPGTYSTGWLSCPSRGAAESICAGVQAPTSKAGNPSGQTSAYTPTADDVGRYLRFQLTVVPAGGVARTATSDPSRDIYVIGPSPTGGQPELKAGQVPGEHGIALLKKWTLPPTSSFRSRDVSVWACTSPTAGQTTTKDFAPSSSGCTAVPLLTAVAWVADATAIVFAIPGDANGKHLLVSDSVTTSSGPFLSLATYVVRSAASPLKGTTPGSATPTPGVQASPSPNPSTSPSANVGATTNTSGIATMSVESSRRVTPGERYSVTVTLSSTALSGIANVRLVTRDEQATTVQTLSSVQVSNGTGTSLSTITARPGKYALMVQFVDSKTGKALTNSTRVRVRR